MQPKIYHQIRLVIFLNIILSGYAFAQQIPLVYDVENTGTQYPKPLLPAISELTPIEPLTDPFAWSDGSGRSVRFEDWSRRRNEIAAEIQHYEIGEKPVRPDTITATYSGGILTVNVTENGKTLVLTSQITLPEGAGPFPAVIGIGRGSGSLPPDIFASRGIVQIPFNFGQVMAWQQKRGNEPINKLYPNLVDIGAYSAWSWGVSRLIDGLELVAKELPIDLKHLAITGCSFAGKMALFAAAFDERIALCIAQESGGGGAAAWRVSETLGNVETLARTSHVWFMESMFQFGKDVPKLPYDHHELMAMVAPRALLVLGNPDYEWLADESGYVSCKAAKRVWETFGISDRFGYSIVAGHGHCVLPDVQRPEVVAFIEKFLLGKMDMNTNIEVHPYDYVDFARWTKWWGSSKPEFPKGTVSKSKSILLEAECGAVGLNWDILPDTEASNGNYVVAKNGLPVATEAPSGKSGELTFPFNVDRKGNYYIFARVNCPTADDDSFWVKIDDGQFSPINGLTTKSWKWMKLATFPLEKGKHRLTISLREGGAKLDKLSISTSFYAPADLGGEAQNKCNPTKK